MDDSEVRAELDALRQEWRELRAGLPSLDEDAFRAGAIALAERSRDQELIDAVWDYREAKIDRIALRTHPAYLRHADRDLDELRERLERSGVAEALRDQS